MNLKRVLIRARDDGGWDIETEAGRSTKLGFEEVLGQIATLIHPDIKRPRFPLEDQDPSVMVPKTHEYCETCKCYVPRAMSACKREDCERIPF